MDDKQATIRELAGIALIGYYDYQGIRKASMNRIREVVRRKNEGIPFDVTEAKKEQRSFDRRYKDEKLGAIIEQMQEEGRLSASELRYLTKIIVVAKAARRVEDRYVPLIEAYLPVEPVWNEYLCKVKGIGPRLGGCLIAMVDLKRAHSARSLWKYAGLDVQGGRSPRMRRGEHITYSPKFRSLMWKVVVSLMRARNEKYFGYYQRVKEEERRKHPLELHLERCTDLGEPKKNYKAHIENRTRRRVAKLFLADLFEAWTRVENASRQNQI